MNPAGGKASSTLSIAYVAGEASGDRHAAALNQALLNIDSPKNIYAWGIGGRGLANAGVRLLADSSRWGAIGIVESLRDLPKYFDGMDKIKRELAANSPDALILVDFGAFNVRLATWARQNGIGPIIYYLPPGSWKRSPNPKWQKKLAELCDLIITPFPWNDEHLKAVGANSHFVGHPLVDIVHPAMDPASFDTEYGIDPRRPVIALLPGSRTFEVKHNLPMMLGAADLINKRVPGTQFLLAASSNFNREELAQKLAAYRGADGNAFNVMTRAGGRLKELATGAFERAVPAMVTTEGFVVDPSHKPDHEGQRKPWHSVMPPGSPAVLAIVENQTYDCMSRADLVIVASGTATLEAAIMNRPMIIVYRVSLLMELEWRMRVKRLGVKFIGMPNIIAHEKVIPELIQHEATPESVSELAVSMMVEPERLMKYKQILKERVRPILGEPGVIGRAASLIYQFIVDTKEGRPAANAG